MLLGHGERVLAQAPIEIASDGRLGTIFVTDRRVLVEGDRVAGTLHGVLRGHEVVTIFESRLDQVTNANVGRQLFGRPLLTVETGAYHLSMKCSMAPEIVAALGDARVRYVPPPPPPPPFAAHAGSSAASPVVVNVHGAPAPPPPAVYLHCRHCGNLNPPGIPRCATCGAGL